MVRRSAAEPKNLVPGRNAEILRFAQNDSYRRFLAQQRSLSFCIVATVSLFVCFWYEEIGSVLAERMNHG